MRLVVLLALFAGCKPETEVPDVEDREIGVRAPLTRTCDDADPERCLLPWPSSAFMKADATTETGVRLAIDEDALPVPDSLTWLNRSDGFSRLSGVAAAVNGDIDLTQLSWNPADHLKADAAAQVIVAQHDAPNYAERHPYRFEPIDGESFVKRTLVVGRPVAPLAPASDYLFVMLDKIGGEPAPREVQVAVGLVEPETDFEAELAAYHAPNRQVLEDAGVDPAEVVRISDFTTRSATDPTKRLHDMMDTLQASIGDYTVEVDYVVMEPAPEIAFITQGRLVGAPTFLTADGNLSTDDAGNPVISGTREIPFRICVPKTTTPYRVALYGHGTGGNINDSSFDRDLAAHNIAKVAIRFDGWTDTDFVYTIASFNSFLLGSEISTAGLMEALAGGSVLLTSMDGAIGEFLTAETIDGEPNPNAGVGPNTDHMVWLGGSMGGTMGAVMISADPRLRTGVLNVPGSGWTHMVPHSLLYDAGIESMLSSVYGDVIDSHIAMIMGQNNWDEVDGGAWADEAVAGGGTFLLQESIGDPVLPNLGTELLANALHAKLITPDLVPIVGLEETAGPVKGGSSLTQYHVPDTGQYDVHGFAARNTIAGDAALEQILELLESAWAGDPTMSFPDTCVESTPGGDCNFLGMWDE